LNLLTAPSVRLTITASFAGLRATLSDDSLMMADITPLCEESQLFFPAASIDPSASVSLRESGRVRQVSTNPRAEPSPARTAAPSP
jgi:hypothetical protein